MRDRVRWGAAGLILGLAVALSLPSFADSPAPGSPPSRTVTVNGSATIRSAPDQAVVTLGVHTQGPTAQDAMQQNAAKMTAVMKALADRGIDQSDIATSSLNLYPNYDSDGHKIVSFSAENDVDVTIHDLSKVGGIIDGAVAAGANVTNGITFRLSDENQGIDKALQAAVADAKSKAQALAEAGDATLGEVLHIAESNLSPGPIFAETLAAADAATPVSPPTLETQVSVTVTWALA